MTSVPTSFWRSTEALHSVVYFAADATSTYSGLGLRGFWRGYFASRAAALGTPGVELVTATFFGFAPAFVARAVPEVWELVDREQLLAARTTVATSQLADALGGRDVGGTAESLVRLAGTVDLAGKPLAAANAALPVPADPLGRLWHAATVLRELHGDCHVAVLVAEGLDGCSANVLAQATGLVPDTQREHRGWSEEAWAAATDRLVVRGWVTADGIATLEGHAAREEIERRTHAAADASLGDPSLAASLTEEVVALSRALESNGPLGYPNPTGVPRP